MHRHCVIAGTGRAGTTFLVQLLTRLGLDSGFFPETPISEIAHAGLEQQTITAKSPYLVKSPWLSELDPLLDADPELAIDCVLIPVRDLKAAAESRAAVQERATGSRSGEQVVSGGLWLTSDPAGQVAVLQQKLSALIVTLARRDIPAVLLWYPRLVTDPRYLYSKLKFLTPRTSYEEFERIFNAVVMPSWVHQFGPDDVA